MARHEVRHANVLEAQTGRQSFCLPGCRNGWRCKSARIIGGIVSWATVFLGTQFGLSVGESAEAPADQTAIAETLDKIYADVTLDPEHNIIAVNFTDADFSDSQLALLRDLPRLETV